MGHHVKHNSFTNGTPVIVGAKMININQMIAGSSENPNATGYINFKKFLNQTATH